MNKIEPGKYSDLQNEDYHGATDWISRSAIVEFLKSPRHYWANYLNPDRPPKQTTPAMEFGSAFHEFILEPHLFNAHYCGKPLLYEVPKMTGLLKDLGREEYDRQKAAIQAAKDRNESISERWALENAGKTVLSNDDFERLKNMKQALKEHPQAWGLIEGAQYETSYFWIDRDTGAQIKARPDILHDTCVVDLKTIKDASPREFQRAMRNGMYHVQAAMILDGIQAVDNKKINTFINICVEKEYPYNTAVYVIDDSAIEYGREQYKTALAEMQTAKKTNEYPGYETQVVGLPGWYE